MVSPINYIVNTPDPLAKVLQGFEAGTALRRQPLLEQQEAEDRARLQVEQGQADTLFGQQQTLFGQQQEDRTSAQAAAQAQQAEAQAMRAELEALSANPNANAADYARLATRYPQIGAEMRQGWELLDEANKQSELLSLGQVYSAIVSDEMEVAKGILLDRREAMINAGRSDEVAKTEAILEIMLSSPEAAKTSIGLALSSLGEGQFDALLNTASTVQTSTAYGNGTVLKVMRDGTTEVTNPAGEVVTGEEAAQTIAAANAAEVAQRSEISGSQREAVLGADIELGGTAAQVETLGEITAEMAQENLLSYNKLRANISNYNQALAALEDGAGTGAIQSIAPSVTTASIELDNIRNRLGLDIIGAVSFGALSQGELDLALDTALPTNMDEAGLRQWVIERRDAQIKMADELRKAALFLATPGNTMQGYLESIGFEPAGPQPTGPDQALSGAQSLIQQFGGGN